MEGTEPLLHREGRHRLAQHTDGPTTTLSNGGDRDQGVGDRAQHFTGLLTPGSLLESRGWDQEVLYLSPGSRGGPCSLSRDLEGLWDWPQRVPQS